MIAQTIAHAEPHHALIRSDVDNSRRMAVYLERHEYDRKTKHDHHISGNDNEVRHMRPAKTVIDAGEDKEQDQDCA